MPERAPKGPKARRLGSFEGFTPQCSESPSYFVLVFLGSRPRMMAEKWYSTGAPRRKGGTLARFHAPQGGATAQGVFLTQALYSSRSLNPALLVSQERARGSVRSETVVARLELHRSSSCPDCMHSPLPVGKGTRAPSHHRDFSELGRVL